MCLEAGKRYKVRINFRRSNARTDSPSASILVDSVSTSSSTKNSFTPSLSLLLSQKFLKLFSSHFFNPFWTDASQKSSYTDLRFSKTLENKQENYTTCCGNRPYCTRTCCWNHLERVQDLESHYLLSDH